jgi:hypothetical protein
MGDTFGLVAISAGGQHNLKIGHMFTKYGSFYIHRKNFLLATGFTEKIRQRIARRW